ncbi:MAG TPA: energy transducer TonB, partial [Gemmatimonadaceae bacterium]|nr:energy transducer TonB [Gemmatimonadaceae bacterium]
AAKLPRGWADERGIDRRAVLLSDWAPTPPQRCMIAQLPDRLPPADSLLATDAVPALLEQGGIAMARGSALLSLKFDSSGAPSRVKVIEGTIAEDVVPVLESVVLSALLPQRPGEAWGVRLRVELDSTPGYRVGRSEKCLPTAIPTPRTSGRLTHAAPLGSALSRQVEKRTQSVRLGVTVDATGTVTDVRLLNSDADDLAKMARDIVKAQRYYPGRDDGIAVTMTIEQVQKVGIVAVVGP